MYQQPHDVVVRCELLSDFVYSFFEHNKITTKIDRRYVVNCFQILYIRSLNTMNVFLAAWAEPL